MLIRSFCGITLSECLCLVDGSVCMETKAVFKSGGPKQSGEEVTAGIHVFCAHMDEVRKSYAYWICLWYYTIKVSLSCRWLVCAWKQRP